MGQYTTDEVEELKRRIVNLCMACFFIGAAVGAVMWEIFS
jgi:hypothetical protein